VGVAGHGENHQKQREEHECESHALISFHAQKRARDDQSLLGERASEAKRVEISSSINNKPGNFS